MHEQVLEFRYGCEKKCMFTSPTMRPVADLITGCLWQGEVDLVGTFFEVEQRLSTKAALLSGTSPPSSHVTPCHLTATLTVLWPGLVLPALLLTWRHIFSTRCLVRATLFELVCGIMRLLIKTR